MFDPGQDEAELPAGDPTAGRGAGLHISEEVCTAAQRRSMVLL